ncbi:MAG: Crp/Fnr family transcriptional regulator [Deltaproteobacteria bacterium]|nr:Crp/Fnr family transcriptional regulator [Deltaproteobacteria bacterium]
MVGLSVLEKVEVFKGLSDERLATIQKYVEESDYQKDDKLFTEGDDALHLWVVIDGEVDLRFELPGGRPTAKRNTVGARKSKKTLSRILGWSCFVKPYKMRLSAYCSSRRCKVIRIKKKDLLSICEQDSRLGFLVMRLMVEVVGYRFQQFQDIVAKTMGEDLLSGW